MEKFLLIFHLILAIVGVKSDTYSKTPVTGRIIGGMRPNSGQFPYTVSIRANNGSTESASFCGGSIIAQDYILTAAHCTRGYTTFEIGMGSLVLKNPVIKVFVYSAIEHPEFDPKNLNNDIALIKVPLIANNVPSIFPVALPRLSHANQTFKGMQATVSGFGRTSDTSTTVHHILQYVQLRIEENKACVKYYGSKIVTENVVCAKGFDKDHNACLGDSGGPLTVKEKDPLTNQMKQYQIGIVSFVSSRGCSNGDPSGYTRVSKYLKWISKITGIPLQD